MQIIYKRQIINIERRKRVKNKGKCSIEADDDSGDGWVEFVNRKIDIDEESHETHHG